MKFLLVLLLGYSLGQAFPARNFMPDKVEPHVLHEQTNQALFEAFGVTQKDVLVNRNQVTQIITYQIHELAIQLEKKPEFYGSTAARLINACYVAKVWALLSDEVLETECSFL